MNLFNAGKLVHILEKRASIAGRALNTGGKIVGGTGRVIQRTANALGENLAEEIGGTPGKVIGGLAKAAPAISATGAAAAGIDELAGNPTGRWVEQKKQRALQRLQGQPATYDPSTGSWY